MFDHPRVYIPQFYMDFQSNVPTLGNISADLERSCIIPTDASIEDDGNYTCQVYGLSNTALAAVTHSVHVKGNIGCHVDQTANNQQINAWYANWRIVVSTNHILSNWKYNIVKHWVCLRSRTEPQIQDSVTYYDSATDNDSATDPGLRCHISRTLPQIQNSATDPGLGQGTRTLPQIHRTLLKITTLSQIRTLPQIPDSATDSWLCHRSRTLSQIQNSATDNDSVNNTYKSQNNLLQHRCRKYISINNIILYVWHTRLFIRHFIDSSIGHNLVSCLLRNQC